jgi:hypothetical protein
MLVFLGTLPFLLTTSPHESHKFLTFYVLLCPYASSALPQKNTFFFSFFSNREQCEWDHLWFFCSCFSLQHLEEEED